MLWPPSWLMPTLKLTFVRSDGFSNKSAKFLPLRERRNLRFFCTLAVSSMSSSSSGETSAIERKLRPRNAFLFNEVIRLWPFRRAASSRPELYSVRSLHPMSWWPNTLHVCAILLLNTPLEVNGIPPSQSEVLFPAPGIFFFVFLVAYAFLIFLKKVAGVDALRARTHPCFFSACVSLHASAIRSMLAVIWPSLSTRILSYARRFSSESSCARAMRRSFLPYQKIFSRFG